MNEDAERSYESGRKRAWLSMLQRCIHELSIDDPEAARMAWIVERENCVQALRRMCEDHGDNDWDDDLNLCDVIEKHLERHLEI